MRRYLIAAALLTLPMAALAGSNAHAQAVTVNATDDIYNAGSPSANPGTNPEQISVAGMASFTFSVSPGATVTLNSRGNFNDADGVGAAPETSSNSGTATISGMAAPGAGYLTGVFLGAASPLPSALDFTGSGGTSFASLAPALDQTFFIGDGLTGDGSGAVQTFVVPAGATSLYLGISDACGYNGSPSCYDDNSGNFLVTAVGTPASTTTPSAAPEPGSWIMMILGFGLVGGVMRSAYRKAGDDASSTAQALAIA